MKQIVLGITGASGAASLLMLGASVRATAAAAQNFCTTRVEVVEQFSRMYAETPIAIGSEKRGDVVEIFSSGVGV